MIRQFVCFFARLCCVIALTMALILVGAVNPAAFAEVKGMGTSPDGETSGTERIERELSETEDRWLAAGTRGDAKAAAQLLGEDYQGMTASGSVQDKAQFVADVKAGNYRADSYHQDERYMRIFGETAVSTGRLSLKHQDGISQTRYTRVYVKRQGRWQLIIMQTTRIVRS